MAYPITAATTTTNRIHREVKNFHPVTNLAKLYTNNEICDVNFLFKDEKEKIPANKCLLAIASPVFQRMFYGELRESGDIDIVDASYDGFLEFLQFFYLDKCELSEENICEVLTLADKYDVMGLMNLCGIFLEKNLRTETVCWIFDLALMFHMTHLIQLCIDRICLETTAVLGTVGFRSCTKLVLTKILDINELSCDEFVIYKSVMLWAEQSCRVEGLELTMANKKQQLGDNFNQIRFPTMTSEEFTQCIAEDGLFEAMEFLSILRYLTLRRKDMEFRFSKQPRRGIPGWTKDKSISVCDRRSQPNLNRLVDYAEDFTVLSVNERILLGQLMLSSFKSTDPLLESIDGVLTIKRRQTVFPEDELENSTDIPVAGATENKYDEEKTEKTIMEQIHQQKISIISTGFTKIKLEKPIIIQPFIEYEFVTDWHGIDNENCQLLFRTQCRPEVMVDGGIRFQFHMHDGVKFDNISDGMITKLYFKKF